MAKVVYLLCAVTSIACAVMLLRGYRRMRQRFLLWCGLCFIALMINNVLLFVDNVLYPDVVLFPMSLRAGFALAGLGLLLYGLIWDAD